MCLIILQAFTDSFGAYEMRVLQHTLKTIQYIAGFDEYPEGLQVLMKCGLPNLISIFTVI